jgi:hypothetical protein
MNYATLLVGTATAASLALLTPMAVTATQSHASAPNPSPTVVTSTIAPKPPSVVPPSDRSLAAQLPVIDRVMDILQHARDDYNGDRARAITALNHAREDLRLALRADNQSEPSAAPVPNTPIESAAGAERGSMKASNERIEDARAMLDGVIANLQHDAHDYGGYRVKAIADVQAARASLTDALRDANAGNPGAGRSDRSLSSTMSLVERSIDTLQRARMDYDGHRAAAIGFLNEARTDLAAALQFDNSKEYKGQPVGSPAPQKPGGTDDTSQAASDARIRDARNMVATAIDNLQNDNHDYGGNRVKALEDLQKAASELARALKSAGM